MNVDKTNFATQFVEVIHSGFYNLSGRTHSYNNISSIRSTMIVEQLVVSTCQFVNFVHVVFYNVRNVQVEFVGCFTMLEVNVRVFCSTTSYRSIWI